MVWTPDWTTPWELHWLRYNFLISYHRMKKKIAYLLLEHAVSSAGELDLSRRRVTLWPVGATETKRSSRQQTNHSGCRSNNNPRRARAATLKVCLQPRLFIHFVWFGMMFLPWITALPIWQDRWHSAPCLRYQRFCGLSPPRAGSSGEFYQTWNGRRGRAIQTERRRGGEAALKGGKMDPLIEEEKRCRHMVLLGEKPRRIYSALFNVWIGQSGNSCL